MTTVDQVIASASRELGRPYVYGAEGPDDFDCSGLMQYSFAQVGVKLPRTADQQYHATSRVSSPNPGDLVFYLDSTGKATHVALYIGAGKMIEAPHDNADVRIHTMYELAGHTRAYGRVAGVGAALAPVITTVTTAAQTVSTGILSFLGIGGLFSDVQEIALEAAFGALGLALIFFGVRKLSPNKSEEA